MTSGLDAIYAELPKLRCIGKCQDACGPILLHAAEAKRFEAEGLAVPDIPSMLASGHLDCTYLGPLGNCTIYDKRPLICRLYGMVEKMRCEHGCQPERWLSDDEAHDIMRRIDAL